MQMETHTVAQYRPMAFGEWTVQCTPGPEGVRYLQAQQPLNPYPERMTDRLMHWAVERPHTPFLAQRCHAPDGSLGEWQTLTYSQALQQGRSMAQALLDRSLSAERPVVILSENGIDHALMALGCMIAGIPYCAVAPQYSLLGTDFGKLRHVLATLTPGLVYARDAQRFGRAIQAAVDCEVVHAEGDTATQAFTPLQALLQTPATPAVDAALQATGADTIVKFLFTSGSTKQPKAVINTHRMWCANQQQIAQTLPCLAHTPPVLVDWLPWNHTFGGNKNFGLTLFHGGSLYIDEGRPTPTGIGETLRNLREIAPTLYFNVPTGFDYIAKAMESDPQLRRNLLSRVQMFFYAGASLSQSLWDRLHTLQVLECGERIVMGTGLGMTESSPSALFTVRPEVRAGDLGVPVPGMELKLVPLEGKMEVRYRGPNITPGYWRNPQATREVFDVEGFFCSGDAVKWRDPADLQQGLCFDGRIAEDFKLATGTFVNVGPLRAKMIQAGAPYIQDVVLTGLDRTEVGALIFGAPGCAQLSGLPSGTPWEHIMHSPAVQTHLQRTLDTLMGHATGSATRIARAIAVTTSPSLELGEITDKGSLNQRAVLTHRAALVHALYADSLPFILRPSSVPAPTSVEVRS